MDTITGEELRHLISIHYILNKEIMEKVTKSLSTLRTSDEVVNKITIIDKAKILTEDLCKLHQK